MTTPPQKLPEAEHWLSYPHRALTCNAFNSRKEAQRFVDRLYELGLPQVTLQPMDDGPDDQGDLVADTLFIQLPAVMVGERVLALLTHLHTHPPDAIDKVGTRWLRCWWD
jgi:hypothetical protein